VARSISYDYYNVMIITLTSSTAPFYN
jgi:hypothetical protein